MKRSYFVYGVIGLVIVAALTWWLWPRPLSVSDLARHKAKYDGKRVVVCGTVEDFRPHVSRRGNPYITFDLVEGTDTVRVFSFAESKLTDGAKVKVTGEYATEKRMGYLTYYNEIDASKGSIQPQ